MIAFVC